MTDEKNRLHSFSGYDSIDSYFECVTACSLSGEGVECVTRCVEIHLKSGVTHD